MTKTSREDLATEVQSRLVAYLKRGNPINESALARAFDVTGLSISDFARIKRIRFVLSEDVQTYLGQLDRRLRRIQTGSEVESQRTRGEIRGSIDWGQTISQRYAGNYRDRSQFVTRTPFTEYQLPQNRLLKTFLSTIHETATTDLLAIDQPWRTDRWDDDSIEEFNQLYTRNVHLDRIQADSETRLRSSALNAARRARQPLYYESYDLYARLQKLLDNDYDDDVIEQLLYETIVIPETSTLFELVCVFRLVEQLADVYDLTLHPIESGSGAIARLAGEDVSIRVFHDATGPLSFTERIPDEPQDEYLARYRSALRKHREFMTNSDFRALYSGRPDILLEVVPDGVTPSIPERIILGEVKHTASKSTLSEGAIELLEYLQFARPEPNRSWGIDDYLRDSEQIRLSGLLITDGIDSPRGGTTPTDNDAFHHVNARDLATTSVVRNLVDAGRPRPAGGIGDGMSSK